ncbi:alpha/beta hydrolase [Chamaesiphon minutus]|uniref:Monoacylglycerol lipase n=1 Tax=Chamaesiphon minutus (strain ATCC 27169 / PCC 6605) TaxID=1173020 RepID=K9UCF1_CHAP6|nr:alpha/beta hydrolase [Chamaesiphon minutus]AFY92767.1 lysophospholipase [Chamaesiphon minutus PCC 6605]
MGNIDYCEYLFKTTDRSNLYGQSWRSTHSHGVVVIVHGYAEHSGRYQWAALQLVDRGFAVYTFDLRGHGKSSGIRNLVRSYDDCLTDLATFIQQVKLKEPDRSLFLFGHSFGGTIAALFAIRSQPLLNGLILSSAFLGANRHISTLQLRLIMLISYLLPKFPTLFLNSHTLSRDLDVVEIYEADLLIGRGRMPARTLVEMLKATAEIQSRTNEIELPILILHGTEDRLVSMEGSKNFYLSVGSKDKSIELYDGFYHELLNEPEKIRVLSDIEVWLRKHLPTV